VEESEPRRWDRRGAEFSCGRDVDASFGDQGCRIALERLTDRRSPGLRRVRVRTAAELDRGGVERSQRRRQLACAVRQRGLVGRVHRRHGLAHDADELGDRRVEAT
jgi:hypothetical protein